MSSRWQYDRYQDVSVVELKAHHLLRRSTNVTAPGLAPRCSHLTVKVSPST
ncbi:mCG1041686 [Mus musculus]|nr:mCG1041686 [Mus musculus]